VGITRDHGFSLRDQTKKVSLTSKNVGFDSSLLGPAGLGFGLGFLPNTGIETHPTSSSPALIGKPSR